LGTDPNGTLGLEQELAEEARAYAQKAYAFGLSFSILYLLAFNKRFPPCVYDVSKHRRLQMLGLRNALPNKELGITRFTKVVGVLLLGVAVMGAGAFAGNIAENQKGAKEKTPAILIPCTPPFFVRPRAGGGYVSERRCVPTHFSEEPKYRG